MERNQFTRVNNDDGVELEDISGLEPGRGISAMCIIMCIFPFANYY